MDEVDEVPQVLRSIPPEYPYGAKRNRVEGEVVVRMLVTSKGVPTNLSIESATPANVFEKAALSAAKRWKFRPGRYKGQAVDTWVLLPFNFELTR
jgi:protein TonB